MARALSGAWELWSQRRPGTRLAGWGERERPVKDYRRMKRATPRVKQDTRGTGNRQAGSLGIISVVSFAREEGEFSAAYFVPIPNGDDGMRAVDAMLVQAVLGVMTDRDTPAPRISAICPRTPALFSVRKQGCRGPQGTLPRVFKI